MEIQLITPSPAITTPYTTAPSTPHHYPTFFYSAPTTPIHTTFPPNDDEDDFSFDFTGHPEPPSISAAEDLFHAGKIKTLNPSSNNHNKKINSFTLTFHQTPGDQTSRSSSPFRISDDLSEEDSGQKDSLTWYNKWNLKNLLLFRSTSEGSARRRRRKDPVNRYSRIRKVDEDVKNSSFRSTDNWGFVEGSNRRVMRKVSAHELHYTANRAVAEEMRRKTYLPYKSGLLGCLGFWNNEGGSVGEISRGITRYRKY